MKRGGGAQLDEMKGGEMKSLKRDEMKKRRASNIPGDEAD